MHQRSKRGEEIAVATWRLDTQTRTAVFASFDGGCPALVHFGRRLPDTEDLETLARLTVPSVAGGQLDALVATTLLPTSVDGWLGSPGVFLKGGAEFCLHLDSAPQGEEDASLRFMLGGEDGVALIASLDHADGCLRLRAHIARDNVSWLGMTVPVPAHMPRIRDHGGRWTGEFLAQERRFATGQHLRESREGRTGHAHFPGMVFAQDACDESGGECLAVTLAWSGGHRLLAEELPDGRRYLQAGLLGGQANPRARKVPELVIAWSDNGFNGLSHALHTHVRANLPGKPRRPVHYNCWEAVYFRHDVAELKDIATRAAALGAERFVLDDGWFKGRNDDTTSLGDWVVDREKYPDGLHPLVDHVRSLGMEFGIWFEPEMVNTDSDLYRAHPDWVLGPEDQPSGRGQFVLDLSRDEVVEHLHGALAAILTEYAPTYVKWDHNRILTGGSKAQTAGLYRLLARLNAEFPQTEIESCASGGGRIDYGILRYTTRVWLSDSNDAQERLRMQHEASRWIPPEVQGSHVGPRTCHTSGRIIPIAFRAWVAAQRHMGFEMDPRELTDEEARTLKQVTAWYRDNRDHLFSADLHRLDSNDPEVFAEMFVSADKNRFTLFRGQAGSSAQIASRPFRLTGLRNDALYEVTLLNPDAVPGALNRNSASPLATGATIRLSGSALMAGALRTPGAFPLTMLVFEGKAVS